MMLDENSKKLLLQRMVASRLNVARFEITIVDFEETKEGVSVNFILDTRTCNTFISWWTIAFN
jgi:hypothetical protein